MIKNEICCDKKDRFLRKGQPVFTTVEFAELTKIKQVVSFSHLNKFLTLLQRTTVQFISNKRKI
jgi:hypothetical protein